MVYQQKEHCVDKNREDILRMKGGYQGLLGVDDPDSKGGLASDRSYLIKKRNLFFLASIRFFTTCP
jgi:hypothetical protein